MRVLTVNAGSSSLKLRVLDAGDEVLESVDLRVSSGRFEPEAFRSAVIGFPGVDAVGHRIVHGGDRFRTPAVLDDAVLAELEELAELAPLQQPPALAAARAVRDLLPTAPAVACFDTAFHASLPATTATYAIPAAWRERWGLRRHGFHGLSHAYASRRARELGAGPRVVTCHLGAGASLAAVHDGRSVDTTMGFTPLEGLVMATRSGSVDPGMLLWLLDGRVTLAEMRDALEHGSGLLALAGTEDMREVVARASEGDDRAGLALDVYVHRLRAGIAAMAASLGGLDAVVFTGGVGENQPAVRERALAGLEFLGPALRSWVVEAREDLEIARETRAALGATRS